ncbi:hypothetical protein BGW36DRAFT_431834 [Talaromyces proteolyticus]|uniref:FAD-binding domain-containing protein n=1 Tax=Talaromyces proteolyticus TaxID=1131652 RepID=A0AAD4PSG9_9EURO|nr:uncharacterized protein BGW36DRAFT_431834 [Talaromyces proteolyticus]KAH8691281.1 hypothetical protein BGW36DRAFT_431834 [Talaromyces proteolyticus]
MSQIFPSSPSSSTDEHDDDILHLTPNITSILGRVGLSAEDIGGRQIHKFREYEDGMEKCNFIYAQEIGKTWQYPWWIVSRRNLLDGLRSQLVTKNRHGVHQYIISDYCEIVGLETETGTLTTENGDMYSADLIIGADGQQSITRRLAIIGEDPVPSGFTTIAMSIQHKLCTSSAADEGVLVRQIDGDRIIHSCVGSKDSVTHIMSLCRDSFDEDKEHSLFGSSQGIQPLMRQGIETCKLSKTKHYIAKDDQTSSGRFILLGDAARGKIEGPFQELSASMSIEDAVSLSAMLPKNTPHQEIPARLKLLQECRKARVESVKKQLHIADNSNKKDHHDQGTVYPEGMPQWMSTIFGYDAWHHSTQQLRNWIWNQEDCPVYWRAPVSFGPLPGPRQDWLGNPHVGEHSTFNTASIRFQTSRAILDNLLPNSSFRFSSLGTIAEATISCNTIDQMDWLGGGGYDMLGLTLHGIQYTNKEGNVLQGSFLVVLFENLADPILTGREELGFPKLFASIDVSRTNDSVQVRAGWRGHAFAHLQWEDLQEMHTVPQSSYMFSEEVPKPKDGGLLIYRYIPAVGCPGKADADYTVVVPPPESPPRIRRVRKARTAQVAFDPLSWQELPTLHSVVSRLAEIPVLGVLEAKAVEGTGVQDLSDAYKLL